MLTLCNEVIGEHACNVSTASWEECEMTFGTDRNK